MSEKFSSYLLKYRKDNGLTQEEMCKIMGVSVRMYQLYERGDYDGSEQRVKKYKDKLTRNLIEKNTPNMAVVPRTVEELLALHRKHEATLERLVDQQDRELKTAYSYIGELEGKIGLKK